MQSIIIKDFGPIPYCSMETKDFTILIGQQATGKSTICKSVYFFKTVRDEIISYLYSLLGDDSDKLNDPVKAIGQKMKYNFINIFGQTKFKREFYIRYNYSEDLFIEASITKDENKYLNFEFSEVLRSKISDLKYFVENNFQDIKYSSVQEDLYVRIEKNKAFIYINNEVKKLFDDDREIFYIPAGRGLLSLLTDHLLTIDIKLLDYISGNFMKYIQEQRVSFDLWIHELKQQIQMDNDKFKIENEKTEKVAEYVDDILKGHYIYKNGKEYLKLKNGSSFPVNFASSGQQEVLWILNLLYIWMTKFDKNYFVVIEEPEAHLFPDTQKKVLDFIVMFLNSNNNQVMITTHSPYILTSANNLLYAGKLSVKTEEVKDIIPKRQWIDFSSFGAYMVGDSKKNHLRTIIDEELQEIKAEEIDKISKVIGCEYAMLFNLEAQNEFID